MVVKENVSLKKFNTFGLDITARYMAVVSEEKELLEILNQQPEAMLVLGGGSNILFTGNYPGLIVKNNILGRELIKEDHESVWLKLGGGENWHQVVLWAIDNGWGGIENLSLIPGTVGAAPMQNIGAYGAELSTVFSSLEAIDLSSGKSRVFQLKDCDFGYRYSVFKGPLKDRFFISRVILKLRKNPTFNISYGAISETLEVMGIKNLTIRDISDAVINIRRSKLPDPERIGNAGSFFKNPAVDKELFNNLKTAYANMPSYPTEEGLIKIPAGWLIEQCNWKGFRQGDSGVHEKQALVLVNYGKARGDDLLALSREIQRTVNIKFGIKLTPEVNIV